MEGGYFKCSIRCTNNQLSNKFYTFTHLQLFYVKYKFVNVPLFDVKFLLFEKHIFCKQKRTPVYGLASLVLVFKLTPKSDDLLPLRSVVPYFFYRYHTLCKSILKCRLPSKSIKLTPFLRYLECLSFEVTRFAPFW